MAVPSEVCSFQNLEPVPEEATEWAAFIIPSNNASDFAAISKEENDKRVTGASSCSSGVCWDWDILSKLPKRKIFTHDVDFSILSDWMQALSNDKLD